MRSIELEEMMNKNQISEKYGFSIYVRFSKKGILAVQSIQPQRR